MSDSNNIQEEGDSPSFLQLFWDLAVIDITTRERATKQLLAYLKEHTQSANQSDYPDLSREMIYTLKRLCSGVCSSRDCARQDTCILQFFPFVPVDCVYKLLIEASEVEGGMKKMEERDQYFGRIFGILSLFRSSRFLKEKSTDSTISVVESATKEIVRLYNLKTWMRELCVQTISTMLKTVHNDLIPIILSQCRLLFEEISMNEDEELIVPVPLSPASLLLMLQIQIALHDRNIHLENGDLVRVFVHNADISPTQLKNQMTIYKESSFTFPKLHPLWEVSIQYIRSLSNTPDATLIEWWTAVTDHVLSASPERRGMCLKVCQLLFPCISSSMLPMLLNRKICTVITGNSGNSKNYLHEQTLKLLDFFVLSSENDKERRIAILNIFFSNVGMDFDQKTRSTTCKRLMETLTAEDMNTFITHCYCTFLQPLVNSENLQAKASSEEEEEEKSSESEEEDIPSQRRMWALENISRLIMNNDTFDPFILIDFLYAICCIQVEFNEDGKEVPSTLSFLHTDFIQDLKYCSPSLSDTVRDKARDVLFSTINALAVKMNDKEKTRIGMTKDHVLYVYLVLKHYEDFFAKVSQMENVTLLREWDEEEITKRKQLMDQIEHIHKRTMKNDQLKQDIMFERLFINLALEQVFKPDYTQFISDLIECYKQFTSTKKRNGERPLAVLLDIVLILLRTSSKALRDTSVQLFGSVCSSLCEEDVKEMLSVFWRDEGLEAEEDEEEMEITMDEDGVIEEEEEEEKEEEDDKEEEEEESDDEVSWDKGLTSEEKEAMKQEDMAIAKILRIKRDQERLRRENKTELINFKSRVIDLIETFVTKQPQHHVMGIVITLLAEICQNLLRDKSEAALNARISNLLKNKIAKNCIIPMSFLQETEKAAECMNKLVELSKQVSLNDPVRRKQVLLCNATCLSVFLRSMQHSIFDPSKSEKSKKEKEINFRIDKAQKSVSDVLLGALQDFKNKRSHLSLLYFETIFTKCPLLCLSLIPSIQPIISEDSGVNNYKKLEFLGLLTCLLRNTANTPDRRGYEYVRNNSDTLMTVYTWAKDKIDNREKEGYEDFRKLPRRKLLNDYIHAYDNTKNAAEKKIDEKIKERKKVVNKEREQAKKEKQMKKTAANQKRLHQQREKKLQQDKMEKQE